MESLKLLNYYKIIKKILFCIILSFFFFISFSLGRDIMNDVFEPSFQRDSIIDLGEKKDEVGKNILREKLTYSIQQGWITQEPLIVRIVKFILRITIVLSVTMILYSGIKYIFEVINGKDLKSADAKKNLINIFIGIIIALVSVSAVNLIISIPKSSIKTGDDLDAFEKGCNIAGTLYSSDGFKEYACKNTSLGFSDDLSNREWAFVQAFAHGEQHMDYRAIPRHRCKVIENNGNWKWISITEERFDSACADLGGFTVD